MATNNLELRLAHSTLDIQGTSGTLTEKWEAWQPALDIVVDDITRTIRSSVSPAFDDASADLYKGAMSWFVTIQAWHAPRAGIGDYSLFDASLILEYWAFTPNGENFDLSHPISGAFADQIVQKDGARPVLAGRVNNILALVLGPTAWMQADSPAAEALRVTCQPVAGADHYDIYSDIGNGAFELLGSVPNAGVNTLSVPAGAYRVRMAPVTSGGIVGILSNTVSVTVETVVATGTAALPVSMSIIEAEEGMPEPSGTINAEKKMLDSTDTIDAKEEMPDLTDIPTVLAIPLFSQLTWNLIQRVRGKKK